MPMDPVIGTIISSLLGFGGAALSGPSQQFRKSFDDTGETNPVTLLGEAESGLKNTANALGKKLKGGVQLRGVAPAVPGLGISDPALGNPERVNEAGGRTLSMFYGVFGATAATQFLTINAHLQVTGLGAFVASDKYLVVDASGNIHVSAVGPTS